MIQIRCDIEAYKKIYTDLEREQLPYATSRAVNELAEKGQQKVQLKMGENFIIRRDWVKQQIKITHFSSKTEDPIHARVEVGKNADFLEKFEPGGVKTGRGGHNIAIPILARAGKNALVPDNLRPKALHLHSVGKAIRGDQRTFLMKMGDGRQGIFQRTGRGPRDYILLYWLTPRVPIPSSLHFVETFVEVAEKEWPATFERWFNEAMRTAK